MKTADLFKFVKIETEAMVPLIWEKKLKFFLTVQVTGRGGGGIHLLPSEEALKYPEAHELGLTANMGQFGFVS